MRKAASPSGTKERQPLCRMLVSEERRRGRLVRFGESRGSAGEERRGGGEEDLSVI